MMGTVLFGMLLAICWFGYAWGLQTNWMEGTLPNIAYRMPVKADVPPKTCGQPENAVDGVLNRQCFGSNAVSSSRRPWIQVDMRKRREVLLVLIHKHKQLPDTVLYYDLYISDSPFDPNVDTPSVVVPNTSCPTYGVGSGALNFYFYCPSMRGRYVTLVLKTPYPFLLCEIEIFSAVPGITNVALRKRASQSSFSEFVNPKHPGYAVDGSFISRPILTSAKDLNPWWALDLGMPCEIQSVTITTASIDMSGVNIYVHDEALDTTRHFCVSANIAYQTKACFKCRRPLIGRHVKLVSSKSHQLIGMFEFQAWGQVLTNVALRKSAWQLTTDGKNTAGRAIDGDMTTAIQTAELDQPWWRVNLGQFYIVDIVTIHNGDRPLSNFQIFVDEQVTDVKSSLCLSQVQAIPANVKTSLHCQNRVIGGYVQIQLTQKKQILHVYEFQIWGRWTSNLAERKAAFMSPGGTDAGKVTDRLLNTGVTITQQDNPWVRVDLGYLCEVHSITIHNGDQPVVGFTIFVKEFLEGDPIECMLRDTTIAKQTKTLLHCDRQIIGRYLTLQLTGRKSLHIFDIKVWGTRLVNLALRKRPIQSSLVTGSGDPDMATDGDLRTFILTKAVDRDPAWVVDLGHLAVVTLVSFIGGGNTMKDFSIYVSATTDNANQQKCVFRETCAFRKGVETYQYCGYPILGRYVTLRASPHSQLFFYEIRVWGRYAMADITGYQNLSVPYHLTWYRGSYILTMGFMSKGGATGITGERGSAKPTPKIATAAPTAGIKTVKTTRRGKTPPKIGGQTTKPNRKQRNQKTTPKIGGQTKKPNRKQRNQKTTPKIGGQTKKPNRKQRNQKTTPKIGGQTATPTCKPDKQKTTPKIGGQTRKPNRKQRNQKTTPKIGGQTARPTAQTGNGTRANTIAPSGGGSGGGGGGWVVGVWINRVCSSDTQCPARGARCFNDRCLCPLGLYYSVGTKQCLQSCTTFHISFSRYRMVRPTWKYADMDEADCCEESCREHTLNHRECSSFSTDGTKCYLFTTITTNASASAVVKDRAWSYYQRNCV
ncbi:hypothetical protein ACOMHN_050523 [Nucella lapillus]